MNRLRKKISGIIVYLKNTQEYGKVYRWVWQEMISQQAKKHAKRMLLILFTITIFEMIQPFTIKFVLDGLISKNSLFIIAGLGSYFACLLIANFSNYWKRKTNEWILGENAGQLDQKTSDFFMEKSLGQHIQSGTTLNSASIEKGRAKIAALQNMLLFEALKALAGLLIAFIFIWFISPFAGFLLSILILFNLAFMVYLNQEVGEVCEPLDQEFRKINNYRVERWDRVERVKTCGKEKEEVGFIREWFNKVIKEDRKFWFWYLKMVSCREMVSNLVIFAVICYGIWNVYDNYWTIGLLYPLISWSSNIKDNIWQIGHLEHEINYALPAVQSMMKILTLPPEKLENETAADLKPNEKINIQFQSISHTYPVKDSFEQILQEDGYEEQLTQFVLKDINFSINSGDKVALIGPSGAGKTTITRLVQRYMNPEQGKITNNGKNLRDITMKSWTDIIGYIPQQAQIFDGTIRYNLTYGLSPKKREKINDEDLWKIMRLLKIDFGERLTDGLDTMVGRYGIKLSGGQAQRVMIGAAVLRQPLLMIIDEATSSLDSTTEKAVQMGLTELLGKNISALIITHR